MFKNYLLVTLRSLSRDYDYALINLFGLSIGIASFLVLALHLESELTYDQHYAGHENLFRVVNEINTNGKVDYTAQTSRELAPILEREYSDVLNYVRFFQASFSGRLLLRNENAAFYWDNILLADENVFEMFSQDIIYGDPLTALKDPLAIAISETLSKRYFGERNPLGETLSTDTAAYIVTLVYADQPENTHLKYNALLSFNRLKAFFGDDINISEALWGISDYTYLQMRDDYDPAAFETISGSFYDKYMAEGGIQFNTKMRFFLEPLAEIHLFSQTQYDEPRGNSFYIVAFSIIAFFVLTIACINYMNLATARSVKREKEIGMRKIIGAHKEQIVAQFLGESFIFAFASLALAMILVHLVAGFPFISSLLGRPLEFNLMERPLLLVPILGLGALVGLVSGLYPAFYLAAIRPITALQGASKFGGRGKIKLRQLLVFLQFVISVSVIACTILMAIQMHYVQTRPLGFDKENKVLVTLRGADIIEKVPFMKTDLLTNNRILGVASAEAVPGSNISINIVQVDNSEGVLESQTFNRFGVDENYFEVMGIEFVTGRNFGPDSAPESSAIINETVARQMGWDEPVGKRVHSGPFENTVIGVVKDFHIHSLHRPVEPLFMHMNNFDFEQMNPLQRRVVTLTLIISIANEDIQDTLSFLQDKFSEYDPTHPFEYVFFDDLLDKLYVSEQRQIQLIGLFAGICILISCLGLFGLASFTTAQRTKEIGIRKILGASSSRIIILLFRDIVGLILVASIVASAISYYVIDTWLAGFQYKEDINLLVFLIASMLAMCVAFLTVALQSYKTARSNPGKALRYEQ